MPSPSGPSGAPDLRSRILGCLLGGAVGDALGAPVEFLSLTAIRHRFGPAGISTYAPAYGREGAITDDTQMSLFTAEGLIRALNRASARGICNGTIVIWHAYRRWLYTQGLDAAKSFAEGLPDGWLVGVSRLRSPRAPGTTCLQALHEGTMGTVETPINDSKGCGGVMRVAPVGLAGVDDAFELGCRTAATTHGHPSGYLSAGFLARTIAEIVRGGDLESAADAAEGELRSWPGHEETLEAVRAARRLVRTGPVIPERIESLGRGFTGEEAIAIALAASMVGRDFSEVVRIAVNHSGDSDSTGAIAGQIRGALEGVGGIASSWLGPLELREAIETIAEDLHRAFHVAEALDEDGCYDLERYTGW